MDRPDSHRIPEAAAALGYAGALPFIIAATAVWMIAPDLRAVTVQFLVGFGVVLLSFTGGVRWGLAMRAEGGPTFLQLLIAAVPAGISWITIFLGTIWPGLAIGPIVQLVLLIVAFGILLWSDFIATHAGEAPQWYIGFRAPLTILVELSLIAALVNLLLAG